MEDTLVWGYCVLSAIVTYIRQMIADFKIEPFYAKTKEDWINHRSSITYDGNGDIFSMRKCPPLYQETQCSIAPECPANYTQEQYEDLLILAVGMFVIFVIFVVHIILLCLLTED